MIHPNGYWSDEEAKFHKSSVGVLLNLMSFLDRNELVIDFGCGNGFYLHHMEKMGFKTLGIDGYKIETNTLENFEVHDLTEPLFLDQKGQVICLEVGEHIPEKYQEVFIDNITRACNSKLVLSWAVEGQPGIGHVNCRNNEYIIHEIEDREFKLDKEWTERFRNIVEEDTKWFEDTLMVFNKI